jgi:ubiquinone/menaquinone biosynthesis C-methylase UbiE
MAIYSAAARAVLSGARGGLLTDRHAGRTLVSLPDVYATITEADLAVLESLAGVLELRAADPQQQAMREEYFSRIEFPPGCRVLEVGCGTGAVTRALASWPGVGEVVGLDPSPTFLERGRELARDLANLAFVEGDARALPLGDDSFDVLVFHTTLCHVPEPEAALTESLRVLRPGGLLAVFDGDYATTTLASGDSDPLQACAEAVVANLVHDRWLVRRLPRLVRDAGFDLVGLSGHSYLEAPSSHGYMLALVDRGAEMLVASGRISVESAEALKAEGRRRSDDGTFFGHIAYASVIARKPA